MNHQNNFKLINLYFSILVLSLIILVSCDEDSSNKTLPPSESTETKDTDISSISLEDLGDREFYKTPRLQFTLESVNDAGWDSVWTMKLDGSDVRKVIAPRKMFPGEKPDGFMHKPVRSPNRRFLAYTIRGFKRSIIDLKTGKITIISELHGGSPNFGWSKDSDLLFFYDDFDLYRYNLTTKNLEKMKNQFRAIEMFTLDDGKTIAGVTSDGAAFFDYDGNEIKRFDLGLKEFSKTRHNITSNGKYLFVKNTDPDKIFELSDPPKVAHELLYKEKITEFYKEGSTMANSIRRVKNHNFFSGSMILEPDGKFLINRYRGKVIKYNVTTGEITPIFSGRGKTSPHNYTILN